MKSLTLAFILTLASTSAANESTVRYVIHGTIDGASINAQEQMDIANSPTWAGVTGGSPYTAEIIVSSVSSGSCFLCGSCPGGTGYPILSTTVTIGPRTVVLDPVFANFCVANDEGDCDGQFGSFCTDYFALSPAGSVLAPGAVTGGGLFFVDEVSVNIGFCSGDTGCPPAPGCIPTALTSDAPPLSVNCFGIDAFNPSRSELGLRESSTLIASLAWTFDFLEISQAFCIDNNLCSGDGGDQMGCTDCPCTNNAAPGIVGGCLNSVGTSGRLSGSGLPSVANDSLRMTATGATPDSFGVLTSGAAIAPANMQNPCFGLDSGITAFSLDGLRCAVQDVQRHGSRPVDSNGAIGDTTPAWGPPNGPPGGLAIQGGFMAGETRYYQLVYRELPDQSCMTGQNTTQAVQVTFMP